MYDIRNPAFIAFLFLTGARVEEICGVREQEEYVQDNHTYKHWNGKYIVDLSRNIKYLRPVMINVMSLLGMLRIFQY